MTKQDEKRLKAVLEAYGADPVRWPEADRHLANKANRKDLESEKGLDALLNMASTPALPQGLADRIAASARQENRNNVVSFAPKRRSRPALWPVAAAMAASLAIGAYLGVANPGGFIFPASETAALDDPLGLIDAVVTDDATAGDSV